MSDERSAGGTPTERPVADERPTEPIAGRPTVDEMSEWSFPASDPPATWTWEPRLRRIPGTGDGSRRVLAGVDDSPGARLALVHAARRAGPLGHLVLAYVLPPLPPGILGVETLNEFEAERRAAGQKLVDGLAREAGVDAETRLLDGAPAEALAELARAVDAEEIVVGARGMGRVAAALGSVSHALLAHADRPVVVVPEAASDQREPCEHGLCTVIVGYDGSPAARGAMTYAARRAARGGRVVAVHAVEPAREWLEGPHSHRAAAGHRAEGRELLRSLELLRSAHGERSDRDETVQVEGPPARAIVAAATERDADEIVIGSRGFGRLRGALGSVSHAVLREADRPVVVIPAVDAAPGSDEPA
jgi:nucleotide-binding universal stress UspA family protein